MLTNQKQQSSTKNSNSNLLSSTSNSSNKSKSVCRTHSLSTSAATNRSQKKEQQRTSGSCQIPTPATTPARTSVRLFATTISRPLILSSIFIMLSSLAKSSLVARKSSSSSSYASSGFVHSFSTATIPVPGFVTKTTATRSGSKATLETVTNHLRRSCYAGFSTLSSSSSLFAKLNDKPQQQQQQQQFAASTPLRMASTMADKDLEQALDSIFSLPNFNVAKEGRSNNRNSIRDSSSQQNVIVIPPGTDYHDKKFLSTSNPFWTTEAGLSQQVIDVLSSKGITHFTPVQGEAFVPVLNGKDVIGRSRTGTGKTLAFGLPALTRMIQFCEESGKRDQVTGRMKRGRSPSMLILCPTRELSKQVQEELAAVAKPLGLETLVVHGGVSYGPQANAFQNGIDVLVGTPGRIIDHLERRNVDLSTCATVVLDEADEMLNMGFADSVEMILDGVGKRNATKTQFLLFSATTPPWVKQIGKRYQSADVVAIDSTTEEGGARVATTVRHMAIQVPPGEESKKGVLEDIIAVEISKDLVHDPVIDDEDDLAHENPIAAAARALKRKNSTLAKMQQKIFGKTIVFTQTKHQADDLVSGSVFKCLTAQALHGDVGQKQRDSTLSAFRAGAFNVLVATDVAARGIDIKDVDLVIQFDPPRDVDTYVHRSGRTGRAGQKGVSVLLFDPSQARDIVRIENDLGHNFKFELTTPPSFEATLKAVAKTSAIATKSIPESTSEYFMQAAKLLLEEEAKNNEDGSEMPAPIDPVLVVARCLAAISRRSYDAPRSRSLLTGELGYATIRASTTNSNHPLTPSSIMYTIGKLSNLSQETAEKNLAFEASIGKIRADPQDFGKIMFDMEHADALKLVEFSKDIDAGGAKFEILDTLQIDRSQFEGGARFRSGGGGRGNDRYGGGANRSPRSPYQSGGGGGYGDRSSRMSRFGNGAEGASRRFYNTNNSRNDHSHTGRSNRVSGGDVRSGYSSSRNGVTVSTGSTKSNGSRFNGRYDSGSASSRPIPIRRRSGGGHDDEGW